MRRRTLAQLLVLALLGFSAACVQAPDGGDSSTAAPPTDPAQPTMDVGTGDLPTELRLWNAGDGAVTLETTVVANETGEVVLADTVTLAPMADREYSIEFPASGNYTISTGEPGGRAYAYVWNVGDPTPDAQVSVTARPGGPMSFTLGMA